jgi:hypothetical protein
VIVPLLTQASFSDQRTASIYVRYISAKERLRGPATFDVQRDRIVLVDDDPTRRSLCAGRLF